MDYVPRTHSSKYPISGYVYNFNHSAVVSQN